VVRPPGGTENQQFLVVVNHFKSKGSGSGDDADQGDGQGGSNASRVKQANALVSFVKDVQASTHTGPVYLTGDFNSYTQEDPMKVLYDAGFTDIGAAKTDEATYLFDGLVGSLDHVLANGAGFAQVTGADVWNINSVESVAYEYSRYNYNATSFYRPDQFRSSDHDPLVVGIDVPTANDDRTLNLLNINDFHGRVDNNTVGFAATVEKLRSGLGDANTLFMSAGDNIGASLFASSTAGDIPTIDVLNALELKSSVGNHEFDKGYADLTGRVDEATDWSYLGANVFKADGSRALQPFDTFEVNGLDVGVIGAVTQETPSLVTPDGIAGLQFRDPVVEVNKVADQLTDGDPANGEADVVVAEYHEGAAEGTPEGGTFEKALAAGGAFAHIATDTSPKVAAIFTGHTHKQYVWDGPVPGVEGKTRPIVQTGNYGENVGQVMLTVDASTKTVRSYTAGLAKRLTATDTNGDKVVDRAEQTAFDDAMVAAYGPRVQEVRDVVTEALAAADVIGRVPVGKVAKDITTAFKNVTYGDGGATAPITNRDDRGSESTLGNLVADSLLDKLSDEQYQGGADIGLTNPGGLRAELLYAGTPDPDTNQDGVVTFAEANAVLPFVNNLWTVKLTGAQFKEVLEQQWQTDAAGEIITSRPFQHLGLSSNVSTTLDESRPLGDRVTSVRVNGEPLDPDRTYTIGTVSFLATGGDNFRAFKQGTGTDTGLVDRDAWMEYLGEHQDPALTPSFARRQVYATGLPTAIEPGQQVSFTLSRLDLTSLGSPRNAAVDVELHPGDTTTAVPGGQVAVVDGMAEVSFTAPADIPEGSSFVVTAQPSGTTVTIPAAAAAAPDPTGVDTITTATVTPAKVTAERTRALVTATVLDVDGNRVDGGTVTVSQGGTALGDAPVANGKAQVRLPEFATAGSKRLTVSFSGVEGTTNPSETEVSVRVGKAQPSVRVAVNPDKVHRNRTRPRLTVTLTAPGQTVSGWISVRAKGHEVAEVRLRNGRATVTLPRYRTTGVKTPSVRYHGSGSATAVGKQVRFRVVR
jgi:5'-nucleotidase